MHTQFQRQFSALRPHRFEHGFFDTHRRKHSEAVAAVDARFFDVGHDPGYKNILAIADQIHVQFLCAVQVAIQQHGLILVHRGGFAHVF